VEMDTAEGSNNVGNGPEAHTTRIVTAPTIQTVATTTPSCGFMSPGIFSAIQSTAKTCADIT
jgi:hypothetical protein